MKKTMFQRMLSVLLCLAMVASYLPAGVLRTEAATVVNGAYTTVSDPETLTRPETIYGTNTLHAGKVTVGKSVSNTDVTVNGKEIALDGENNFLVTISQSAQVMGLASQSSVPVDVVFVLDTSGSMDDNDRAESLVTATNSAIKTLLGTNEHNRVAVVAFSSENYGEGTSNGAAANVLSSLAHYTGNAATSHLQWVNSEGNASGNGRNYIAGRNTVTVGSGRNQRSVLAYRHGKQGGTNIQAGIVAGANILTAVTNTTYTDPASNQTVTRIPFLIVVSDGQPTFSYDDDTWYDPTLTGNNAADERGPGSGSYEGNGFIAALTAAYYKGKITEHYYGSAASGENRCFVYTMGVEIEALDDTQGWNGQINSVVGVNQSLAQITLDPASQTVGDYAATNAKSYWNYGNTAFENRQESFYGWKTYWDNYLAGVSFGVRVDSGDGIYVWIGEGPEGTGEPQRSDYPSNRAYQNAYNAWRNANYAYYAGEHYTFTADSIAASKRYVNGVGYTGGIAYNDEYFAADDVSDMEAIFEAMLRTIQEKAISAPTKVTTGDHNFDGYVNFYDPIGEYMEVKDMKGIVADGYFYQGASFAKYLKDYGTANANEEFDELIHKVIKTRMNLSAADDRFATEADLDAFIDELLIAAQKSQNQASYTDNNNFDNSFIWWGNAYNSGEEDEHVQLVAFADNDTIDYITDEETEIPEGADYVCRSYFFYGEAGGANTNPDHEYLYFVVRVQRELKAPYQQTVVISAPASLLSMEKVLITETYDDNNNPVYTASVEKQEPARVVYEVGLWDSITPQTVSSIVSAEYVGQTVNGEGSVNYDAATDTYHFFSNDWDRSQTLESHHRAMAKATFDAAADNAFYTYQVDTLLVDANGDPVTADPAGGSAYYVREYYDWAGAAKDEDGLYAATKKTQLIHVEIPAGSNLTQKDGKWYIPAGVYTAATLEVNGDDTEKDDPATLAANDGNFTGTSSIVAHPHRTGDTRNSHYTVYLGNNGKLSLVADTPKPVKTVSVNLSANATDIVNDEGKAVQVGDVLTYTVEVSNILPEAADITVTDYIPVGTAFVAGSAGSGTAATGHTKDTAIVPDSNNVLTWVLEDVPAGETRYVSFQVTVTIAALSLNAVPGTINNSATVYLNNGAAIVTNTTHNAPYGKSVTGVNNLDADGRHGYKVGDVLVYHIRFHNTATDSEGNAVAADVTVTDKIPAGTTFQSADNGGSYNAATGTVTWNFEDMAANTAKTVSFRVVINASAKAEEAAQNQADGIEPATGEIYLPNTATIVIDHDPDITYTTNTTQNWADVGDLKLSKTVADGGDTTKIFTLNLSESTGLLSGKYPVEGGSFVEFTAGKAQLTISHGQTLTVKGLPAGAIISVAEDVSALPGWTPTYNTQSVTIAAGAAATVASVSVTNTYTLKPLTVTVKGTKALQGVALPNATTFGFVALPDSGNPVVGDPLTGEVTVQALGVYNFTITPKTFTKPGEYKYTLYEIDGGMLGVDYDEKQYTLVFTVTDNGDGTMSAEATLDGVAFDPDQDTVDFTNTFTPEDIPLVLVAKKTLKVYDPATDSYTDANPAAGKFRFQITEKGTDRVVATGTNASDGTITFTPFYFDIEMLAGAASKDFTYVISEVVPELAKDPNMLYDTVGKEITVTLSYDAAAGKLVASVNGDSDGNVDVQSDASFVNYSNPDSVEIRPQGTKTTENAPERVSFSFAVINTESGNEAAAGIGAANGSISFSVMSFSEIGTYTYWIKEANAGNTTNGITYDLTRYLMKVVVSRNDKNRLVADVTYWSSNTDGSDNVADYTVAVAAPSFQNKYQAGGYINLTATKVLEGRTLKDGEFAFKLTRQDNNGEIDGIAAADGTITFSTMYYSMADIPGGQNSAVIHYVMHEVVPTNAKLPGVSYDTKPYDVYVRITNNGNGQIQTELVKPDGNGGYTTVTGTDTGVVFRNTYQAYEGDVVKYRLFKNLKGRDIREGEFEFGLYLNGQLVDVASNDADGYVTFTRTIPATAAAGTYEMVIKELEGTVPGVTYSTQEYTIYVKITDNGEGKIEATVHLTEDGEALPENATGVVDLTDRFIFENAYVPHDAPVQLEATKELTGRDLVDKEFSFVVRENTASGKVVAVGSNDAQGEILFSSFNITAAQMAGAKEKTFTYVVMESNNQKPGVTVDDTPFTVTVTVTDNGTGSLSADIDYPGEGIVFKNAYVPTPVELPLVAFKELTGKKLLADEFTFVLKDGNKTLQTVKNAESGAVRFENLKFTEAGTYIYTLSEEGVDTATMDYDGNIYTIKVEVTDDLNGKLNLKTTITDTKGAAELIRFHNTYTPAPLPVILEGTKTVVDTEGKALTFSPAGFEFELRDSEGKLLETQQSAADGKIRFEKLSFTAAGEYRYLVSEKVTDKAGYTTDPTVWCVHITIGYDREKGELFESDQYVHLAPEAHSELEAQATQDLEFVNVYDPADVTLTLKVKKQMEGRELKEHEFLFYMVNKATGLRAAEGRNHADGTVAFQLSYNKAGTYSYTIREYIPAKDAQLGGVTYSDQTYDVTVEVTDNGDGALKVKVGQIETAGSAEMNLTETAVFVNKYEPAPVDVTVQAVKNLEGMDLTPGKFSFQLVNLNDPTDVKSAVNSADGTILFEKLTFTAAGEHEYLLTEVQGTHGGMIYDSTVYKVNIVVTDDGRGVLSATTQYSIGDEALEAVPVFRNRYEPKPADLVLKAQKIYEGGEMKTFDFVLSGTGFETQTKQNDADGNVAFDPLTFTNAGTYTFTLKEQENTDWDFIRWDTNVYTLLVTVTDDGQGELEVTDLVVSSETGKNDLVFRNVVKEIVTKKDVFLANAPTVSINGKNVKTGDELLYTVSYTNYSGKTAAVTITDKIPAHTTYVDGSADQGGILADGVLTWNLTNIAPDETVTVSFKVKVTGVNVTVENSATVLEGDNEFRTNTVTSSVPEDKVEKTVFSAAAPTVSVDGKTVKVGDELIYKITYRNSYEAAAEITLTDKISAHTAYVEGSADNGGVYADGTLTWKLKLAAGEAVTVSFKVKVVDGGVAVENQATALEGNNEVKSNKVTTSVEKPLPPVTPDTGDSTNVTGLIGAMSVSALGILVMLAVLLLDRKKESIEQ